MIDDVTIRKICRQFAVAMNALEAAIESEMDSDEVSQVGRIVVRHLVRAELGRDPNHEEIDTLLTRVQDEFSASEPDGGG